MCHSHSEKFFSRAERKTDDRGENALRIIDTYFVTEGKLIETVRAERGSLRGPYKSQQRRVKGGAIFIFWIDVIEPPPVIRIYGILLSGKKNRSSKHNKCFRNLKPFLI